MDHADSPTVPPSTWSFDNISFRQEDKSPGATAPQDPAIPSPTWPFDDFSTHRKDTSAEAPPLVPTEPASAFASDTTQAASVETEHAQEEHAEAADAAPEQPDSRRYKIRSCRICFDEVHPTFEPVTATTQFLRQKPRVVYISDDPDCGRLMRPCKCKGTQQYVHEGCLRAWRMAAGTDRNLWKCPTCMYEYRLNRLSWGAWVSSKLVQAGLTLLIMVLSVFLLGFVADPILRYANPVSMLADYTIGVFDDFEELEDWIPDEQPDTWSWHFTRGFLALGFLGMFKSISFMRPWQLFRAGGGIGGRRRGGRDRLENVSWVVVIIGVVLFLQTVWKVISALSARVLNKFSDTIVDVPGQDDEDEDEEEDARPRPDQPHAHEPPIPESRKDQ